MMQDDALDRLLAQAAAEPPKPSPALIDRVLADALAMQPGPQQVALRHPTPRPGLFARLADRFGGAPVLAAGSAAAVLGLALGYLDPTVVDTLAAGWTETGSEELFPSVEFLTEEG